jgi:hypothetical protein
MHLGVRIPHRPPARDGVPRQTIRNAKAGSQPSTRLPFLAGVIREHWEDKAVSRRRKTRHSWEVGAAQNEFCNLGFELMAQVCN